jgi:hypothetical protein
MLFIFSDEKSALHIWLVMYENRVRRKILAEGRCKLTGR